MADSRKRSNVLVGAPDVQASGGALIGPPATETANHPTDATTALKSELDLKPAGYVSNEGVTKTVDRETTDIDDWNGDDIVTVQSKHSVTLKTTFMEAANMEVLKMIAGEENVTEAGGKIKVVDNANELPHRAMVFEMKGSAGKKVRVFAPDAQVTNVGDVKFVRNDVIKYEATIKCFTDADGNKLYSFFNVGEE
ncbi:hypothetical protein OS128_05155 [Corynebacterium sp. P5848]|uniref:phage tail tube protein n=1 Tax=Corynebacterium marambiense TaxID=2765364 RepID=UPI002260D952|nr:hypothetical protein [Corynebacterium marambiense]MCX7542298.1 hypothetical protein [Corynebacterium marambiense]